MVAIVPRNKISSIIVLIKNHNSKAFYSIEDVRSVDAVSESTNKLQKRTFSSHWPGKIR
jgi:hypothetical protein